MIKKEDESSTKIIQNKYRSITSAMLLFMLCISGLFVWSQLSENNGLNSNITVSLIPGIMATISAGILLISFFAVPVEGIKQSNIINYTLVLSTLTVSSIESTTTYSAFLGLLIASLTIAGYFKAEGIILACIAVISVVMDNIITRHADLPQLLALLLVLIIPLLASVIAWYIRFNENVQPNQSYNSIKDRIDAMSSQSEIVINTIGDGVVTLDDQGVISLFNPAAEKLLGWDKKDAVGLSYKSIIKLQNSTNEEITESKNPIYLALTTNKSQINDDLSIITQSGKSFLASLSITPVNQQVNNGVIIVFRDITTEKSDEKQRAEFISTASHEMRTPVASIEGYLGLALNPATATIDDKARGFISKAHESAQHLGRLFQDLLDVSKADDARLKNTPSVIDITAFIGDVVQGLAPKAKEKGLNIVFKPTASDNNQNASVAKRVNPMFYANVDRDHLREISQNLIENAIKYTSEGEISIDIDGNDKTITISFKDTGIGIPKEDQPHLFQKFYRVDNSDTREIGGTGLGLYLCRKLSEVMNGRIWVESEYKKGSTFFLEIPRISSREAQRIMELTNTDTRPSNQETTSSTVTQTPIQTQEIEKAPIQTYQVAASETYQQPAQPVQPTQAMSQPQYQQNTASQYTDTRQNTPILEIESNPNKFISNRRDTSINIPPRR